jgi:hypothetical protein
MPVFLDTLGYSDIAIAVCDRCKMKRPHAVMRNDPNFPGLRVCNEGCADQLDPYRLPARKTERITIRFPRPDLPLGAGDNYLMTGSQNLDGSNQYQISTQGNTQTPQNNGNLDTIAPNPPDNTST